MSPPDADELLQLVYEKPYFPTAQKRSQEKPGQTLQTIALVHETSGNKLGSAHGQ